MQKHVNLVDLVKSFPTNIYLQNLASIQKRTSPIKFAHLAENSGKGSISNLSTKAHQAARLRPGSPPPLCIWPWGRQGNLSFSNICIMVNIIIMHTFARMEVYIAKNGSRYYKNVKPTFAKTDWIQPRAACPKLT